MKGDYAQGPRAVHHGPRQGPGRRRARRRRLRHRVHPPLRGQVDEALKTLTAYVDEYRSATCRASDLPEVFIWNSIARINLENGRLDAAMKAYEKAFESVPGSKLSEEEKKIWLGRLHHGRGRTLARMGKHEEAWKEAETVQQMIAEGGERGKQFEPVVPLPRRLPEAGGGRLPPPPSST